MCNISSYAILSETDNSQISFCKSCKNFSLIFKSNCISFSTLELEQFRAILGDLEPVNYSYSAFGKKVTILQNKKYPSGFCLSEEDVEELKESINQSLLVHEAFSIIYN